MIIALAFVAFAVNSVIFVATGDWLNGISALVFAVAWGALAIMNSNRKVDRLIEEAAPRQGCRVCSTARELVAATDSLIKAGGSPRREELTLIALARAVVRDGCGTPHHYLKELHS